jgi:hypothetical protein
MYSIDDPTHLGAEIARALVHFAKKHGADPAKIIVHPDVLKGYEGELVIESRDNGQVYRATIEASGRVGKKWYMITDGGE